MHGSSQTAGFAGEFHHSARSHFPAAILRMPDLGALSPKDDPTPRIPLSPFTRGLRQPTELDPHVPPPLPRISVVASRPEDVLPAALTEVEGMDPEGGEIRFGKDGVVEEGGAVSVESKGLFGDLWSGFVEDLFGPRGGRKG